MSYSPPNDPYDQLILGGAWPSWMGFTGVPVISNLGVYWPLDDPVGGTVQNQGGSTIPASIREASGNWGSVGSPNTDLWFPVGSMPGTLGNTSILSSGTDTCFHNSGNGGTALAWTGLSTAEKNAVAPTGAMSSLVWFNYDDLIGGSGNGVDAVYGQFGGYNLGSRYETWTVGGISTGFFSPAVVVPGATMMAAHTFDGSTSKVYINGVLQSSAATTGPISQGTVNVEFCSLLGTGSSHGYLQKLSLHTSALTQAQIQGLFMLGAQSLSEAAGSSLNVYPFSRQAVAANTSRTSISLTNTSDTPMYISLGDTTHPATASKGIVIPPNNQRWANVTWKGAIQIIHDAPFGAKALLIEQV